MGVVVLVLSANEAVASPLNEHKAENNPNVVAYLTNGIHTVIMPDGSLVNNWEGGDLVQQAGLNFHQFFEDVNGNRIHTLFRNIGDGTDCPSGWWFLENPYDPTPGDTWGYYFPEGDNYCVRSNYQVWH